MEKRWIKHRAKPPEHEVTFSLVPSQPMDRGIPEDEIRAICQSLIRANAARKREDMNDLIHGFATVEDPDPDHKHHPSLRLALLDQIETGNGAERFAHVQATKKPIRQNKWIRDHWILRNWLAFQDATVDQSLTEVGLCDLEDAVAAGIIQNRFDCGEFSTKTFRRFREKYQLRQVPVKFRFRGILKNTRGVSHWEITAVGGKTA